MSTTNDPISDYRQRLTEASRDLPPDVRSDLHDDLDGHLDEIRRSAGTDAEIRTALDRLGRPEDIVHAAAGEAGVPPPPDPTQAAAATATRPTVRTAERRQGVAGRDVSAILLVVFGAIGGALVFLVFPPLMPIAAIGAYATGLVLLWTSRSWTSGEKLLASLVWPGGLATPLLLGMMGTRTCVTEATGDGVGNMGEAVTTCTGFAFHPAVGIPLFIAVIAAPIVIGLGLLARASRRAAA